MNGTPAGSYNPNSPSYTPVIANNYRLSYDNLYYTTGNAFDYYGIVFTTTDGQYSEIYSDGSNLYLIDSDTLQANPSNLGYLLNTPTFVPTSATPEPSSLVLLGTGCLSLLGAARRKLFRKA